MNDSITGVTRLTPEGTGYLPLLRRYYYVIAMSSINVTRRRWKNGIQMMKREIGRSITVKDSFIVNK